MLLLEVKTDNVMSFLAKCEDENGNSIKIPFRKSLPTITLDFSGFMRGIYHLSIYSNETLIFKISLFVEDSLITKISTFEDHPLPFILDGPQFRTQLNQWECMHTNFRTPVKVALDKTTRIRELYLQLSKEYTELYECFKLIYYLFKGITSLTRLFQANLLRLMSKTKKNSELYISDANEIQSNLLAPLTSYISTLDHKILSSNKKQYQDVAKDFYSYIGKNLSNKSDKQFLSKRIKFELKRFDFYHFLASFIDGYHFRELNYSFALLTRDLSLINDSRRYRDNFKQYTKEENEQRMKLSSVKCYNELTQFLISDDTNIQQTQVSITPHLLIPPKIFKEGLLWGYKSSGKGNGWHKQWVVLKNSTLFEYSDWKTDAKRLVHEPLNLTFACIKRSAKKTNGFDIITIHDVTRSFQAESENEVESWMHELQLSIYLDSSTIQSSLSSQTPLQLVQSLDSSNLQCCDCKSTDQVEWISINLLCVICIKCSGIHRSLGSHISKIRSLQLDSFPSREHNELLKYVSNKKVNDIYEPSLPPNTKCITSLSLPRDRESYIRDKYVHNKFVTHLIDRSKFLYTLIEAIDVGNIYFLQRCISEKIMLKELDIKGQSLFQYSLRHYKFVNESPVFFLTEFLILNGLPIASYPDTSSIHMWSNCQLQYWKSKIDSRGGNESLKIVKRCATTHNVFSNTQKVNKISNQNPNNLGLRSSPSTVSSTSKRWSTSSLSQQ